MYSKDIKRAEEALRNVKLRDTIGGRHKSQQEEDSVRKSLWLQGVQIFKDQGKSKNDNSWHDGLFRVDGKLTPINIKITEAGLSSDNVSSKGALAWVYCHLGKIKLSEALTLIGDLNQGPHQNLSSFINENLSLGDNGRDYYYFVYYRNEPTRSFITSMRRLSALTINSSNIPFQVKWESNRPDFKVSYLENMQTVMDAFGEGVSQNATKWIPVNEDLCSVRRKIRLARKAAN